MKGGQYESMNPTNRRKFLQHAGAWGATLAVRPSFEERSSPTRIPSSSRIPPHRALHLPGVHAYPSLQSVQAGEIIRFHVSSTVPTTISICRLGSGIDDPATREVLHDFPTFPPSPQPIHPGSYAHVPKGIRKSLVALTLECWVRPWTLSRLQGVISQEDKEDARGFALGLGQDGYAGFYLGDGQSPDEEVIHRTAPGAIQPRVWQHLVARWDGEFKEIWINGKRAGRWPFRKPALPGPHPIRLGAMSENGVSTHFLDADIAMPSISGRALTQDEIQKRHQAQALEFPSREALLACWPLDEEKGDSLRDLSGNGRNARLINLGTWMIGGPSFDGDAVPRYRSYDPARDVSRGHGLRFASDDLYDCRWKATHAWKPPLTAKAGLHAVRIHYQWQGEPQDYYVTFNVKRGKARARPPILVLLSTSTWLAYNAVPFCENPPPGLFLNTGGHKNSHPEAPAFSCYRNHHAGQPSYQFGLRMPWPCAGPDILYSSRETGYSHLMRAERFLHVWLDQSGYRYDVVTDLDLHQDPGLLRGYRTVMINGHSEYWSVDALRGLERYLREGGTAVVLSGNTMFWRTSFNREGTVMECRKFDERIGGRGGTPVGELFHSHDGQRGSLLRECGHPAWQYVGLECCGWGGVENREAGVYTVTRPDHFLFHQPESVGLKQGETFGHGPGGDSRRAVGHEYDVRLSTLLRMTRQYPPGFVRPEEPSRITTLAVGKRPSNKALDYFTQPVEAPDGVVAEMIYWERPEGGRVFHAGAIGAGWALEADPRWATLMRNVLHAFGVDRPT